VTDNGLRGNHRCSYRSLCLSFHYEYCCRLKGFYWVMKGLICRCFWKVLFGGKGLDLISCYRFCLLVLYWNSEVREKSVTNYVRCYVPDFELIPGWLFKNSVWTSDGSYKECLVRWCQGKLCCSFKWCLEESYSISSKCQEAFYYAFFRMFQVVTYSALENLCLLLS